MPTPTANDVRHRLNAVCPYFTMFPVSFPLRVLARAGRDAMVLDPFCGRGTTNYAARFHGLPSYGVDTSPVAVAIARAKLANTTHNEVLALARKILKEERRVTIPKGSFWNWAYHPQTLSELCRLREGLLKRKSGDTANMLRAIVLGCLHGPRPKHLKNAGYFSNQMPRTYASKPDYSVRFWQARELRPPLIPVMDPIARKAARIFEDMPEPSNASVGIRCGDSTRPTSFSHVPDGITHVLTSPPYYGLRTYVEDQWLRHWFLGGSPEVPYGQKPQVSHESPEEFASSLAKVWDNCGRVLADNGLLVIRFGSIASRQVNARALLSQSFKKSQHHWRITKTIQVGTASEGKRQADVMGTTSVALAEYDVYVRPA